MSVFGSGAVMEVTMSINHLQMPAKSAMMQMSDRPNTEFRLDSGPRIVVAKGNSSGAISFNAGDSTVTGVGTKFTTFTAGKDSITANGEAHQILEIDSDTLLITADNWTTIASDVGYTGPIAKNTDWWPDNLVGFSHGIVQGNFEKEGTISVRAGSNEVTGSGTLFTMYYNNGDYITANGEAHQISSIESDTELHTNDEWTTTDSNAGYGGSLVTFDFPYDNMTDGSYHAYLEINAQAQDQPWQDYGILCKADCTPVPYGSGWYSIGSIGWQPWDSIGSPTCPNPPCTGDGYSLAVSPESVISYGGDPNNDDYWRSPALFTITASNGELHLTQ